ncbi:MAG: class I SAM-dependent methyltransferase [Gemmatimonadota bacterium]|nr:class I SAM-dependent methyltransferase [Gemmatimonadota bacterium]
MSGATGDRLFDPARARRLDDPDRPSWLPPAEVLSRLEPAPGEVVADVGSGTGYFALPLAERVEAGEGRVIALELQPEMMERLVEKIARGGAPPVVEPVRARAEALPLVDGSVDLVLLAGLWHELEEPVAVAREARRVVRSGGRIGVLDWRPDVERPPGPPIEHRLSTETVRSHLEEGGWEVAAEHRIGPYNVLLVAR